MHGLDRRGFLAGIGVTLIAAGRGAAQDAPGVVTLRQGSRHVIEGGREHRLAETVFEIPTGYAGQEIGLEVGPGARVDVLRVRLAPGVRDIDRFLRIKAGARIGFLDVEAAGQTDHPDHPRDGFVQIRDDDVSIDAMRFLRIDRCVLISEAARVRIGRFDCTSYSKGLRVFRSEDVSIGSFYARGRSPNAVPGKPGENGLSITDSQRLRFDEVVIEDAAEHSLYLAGGTTPDDRSEDVRFGRIVSRRAGQCGFKCKSPISGSRNVSVGSLEVFDSAYRTRAGSNEDALRVEKAENFRIGRLSTHAVEGKVSCYAGVYLNGVRGFALEGGHVERAGGPMVLIEDSRGPNLGIAIADLDGGRLRSHGYHLNHTHGNRLEGLAVDGGVLDGVGGDAVLIDGNAIAAPGTNHIRIAARHVRGALVQEPTARVSAAGVAGVEVQVAELG